MESHKSLLISADSLFTLTLEQIAWACSVEPAWIQVLVDEAILSPSGVTAADWRFSAEDLTRARRAWRRVSRAGSQSGGAGFDTGYAG